MTIYTVHVPHNPGEPLGSAERVRFVPERFSWGAFVFGPLWLLANRLWLALVLWIAAIALLGFLGVARVSPAAVLGLGLLIEYFLGLEGNGWLAAALRNRGLMLSGVVAARDADAAEAAYFQRPAPAAGAANMRTMPPRTGESAEFVGLSPDAGG